MRYSFTILAVCLLFWGCGETPAEEGGQIMEYTEDIGPEEIPVEETEEEREFEIDFTQVISANVGAYQEQALMVLKHYPENEDGLVPIEGYYFYIKNQKNLDLVGVYDPVEMRYVLTESYKGKATGYMEFVPSIDNESFWSPASNTADEQELTTLELIGGDPYEFTLALNGDKFVVDHKVMMFDAEQEYFQEVTDKFAYTIVNDQFFVFDLKVVCANGHSGSISGVAKFQDDMAYYKRASEYSNDMCRLTFDLSSPDEVVITEQECNDYHGARASFSTSFSH